MRFPAENGAAKAKIRGSPSAPAMAVPPQARPAAPAPQPLGLPRGSVRAGLALILSGTLWYSILTDRPLSPLLVDAVVLVVAFYFGVRSSMPPAPVEPPTSTWQPLFLPRGVVRTFLLLGFVAVIGYTWYRTGRVGESLLLIGQVLGSYVSGYAVSAIVSRRLRSGRGPSAALAMVRHAIAAFSLGITGVMCWSLTFGQPALPVISQNLLAWTVAFYFGSRLTP